jgi:MYXO-CTERM domain-containing protein
VASEDVACDGEGEAAAGVSADDCDDAAADVFTGASEVEKDDIDQDCDGADIGGCPTTGGPGGFGWLAGVLMLWTRRRWTP